ncbi:MAG: cyclic nucleotide-binding domain-containing protein [Actinomycetia bacterium]|nr:cyclic nucleotide-binding domain-containing protein [Actinomycetes bacterium]
MDIDADRHGEDTRRLREFTAFDNFSDDDLDRLVRAARHTSSSAPWPLIHEHTPAGACYILLRGKVGVYVGSDEVATLGPGEVIGESVLSLGKLRSATVTTTGPVELLHIDRDDLVTLLETMPALRELMDATVERHARAEVSQPLAKPKPTRSKVSAAVPTDLVKRFEHAASTAGVTVADALEDALTQWIDRKS